MSGKAVELTGKEPTLAEHQPNPVLVAAMAAFFVAMTLAALVFWVLALVLPGGITGAIAFVGPTGIAIVGALHIPTAIVGILLWQWYRRRLPALQRVALEAATLYFGLLVLISIFFNYLAVSFFDSIS